MKPEQMRKIQINFCVINFDSDLKSNCKARLIVAIWNDEFSFSKEEIPKLFVDDHTLGIAHVLQFSEAKLRF